MKYRTIGLFVVFAQIVFLGMLGIILDHIGFIEVDDPVIFAASCMIFGMAYEKTISRLNKKRGDVP